MATLRIFIGNTECVLFCDTIEQAYFLSTSILYHPISYIQLNENMMIKNHIIIGSEPSCRVILYRYKLDSKSCTKEQLFNYPSFQKQIKMIKQYKENHSIL